MRERQTSSCSPRVGGTVPVGVTGTWPAIVSRVRVGGEGDEGEVAVGWMRWAEGSGVDGWMREGEEVGHWAGGWEG